MVISHKTAVLFTCIYSTTSCFIVYKYIIPTITKKSGNWILEHITNIFLILTYCSTIKTALCQMHVGKQLSIIKKKHEERCHNYCQQMKQCFVSAFEIKMQLLLDTLNSILIYRVHKTIRMLSFNINCVWPNMSNSIS